MAHHGARQHAVGRLFPHRHRFAGYHGLVYIGVVFGEDVAVDGYLLSLPHLDGVAALQGGHGHLAQFAAAHQACRLGRHAHELPDGRCGAVLGAFLEPPSGEHEGDNHDRGIEVGVPLDAPCAPHGVAGEGVERAEEERHRRAQRHERVHVGRGVRQLAPGRGIELPSAKPEVGGGDDEQHLVGEVAPSYVYPSHGERHGEQCESPGEEHPPAEQLHASAFYLRHAHLGVGDEVVAGVGQFLFHVVGRYPLLVVFHGHGAPGQIGGGAVHAVHSSQGAFHLGRAGGAHHSHDGKCFLKHFVIPFLPRR